MSDDFNEKVNEAKDKAKEALNAGKEVVGAFMEEHDVKSKLNAGKDKVHEKIKGLAFRGMLEKKVSAETRAKYPALDKLIPLTNYIACGLAVVIVVVIIINVAGSGGRGGSGQTGVGQKVSATSFGNYPVDYGIAYLNMAGYSKAPSVKQLYGPNANFLTSFQGLPASVTLESASGTTDEFTATLLLSIQPADSTEMRRISRMQVKFEADAMAERSYVRYLRLINLINGTDTVLESYGDTYQDAECAGGFGGSMQLFWDVSEFQ